MLVQSLWRDNETTPTTTESISIDVDLKAKTVNLALVGRAIDRQWFTLTTQMATTTARMATPTPMAVTAVIMLD